MLCATPKPLHTKIKEVKKDKLYLTTDSEGKQNVYVLGEITEEDLVKYHEPQIYIDGWADISLENWLNLFGLNEKDKERVRVVY